MADNGQDELVSEFCSITGASPEKATHYLAANGWQVSAATNSYFQDEDEGAETGPSAAADAGYTGPRTLDGRPAPASSSRPARSTTAQPKRKGVATLGSLSSAKPEPAHREDDDYDDDDYEDEEDDNRGNLFAGGEKSGLAVQDPKQDAGPRKIISDILAKARENAGRPESEDESSSAPSNQFRGTGMTLGGDGVESRSIADPNGPIRSRSSQPIERVLHIWQDGFSIDDGDLRRFDDPANQQDLAMIRAGRAPLHLMNVDHDQAVDVKLEQHDTPYKALPKKYKPFSGSGQRLGSPVPHAPSANAPAPAVASGTSTASDGAAPSSPIPDIDPSQPTVTIRLQLPDGVRLPARFNTTSTLGDVYDFVQRASTATQSRPWVLATTFPNKEHTDKSLVLGEMPEFKKGGTAVVKWK
ncbi:SEP domain protein [Cordyceps fumosorosea ARSEF 2679]|uniref:SEP domain protein n=1 Tax=Cordyceps fumosorosea (strain ARSEF 2679) TaxID=1081104 RepID=A0A162MXW2_CORFA|nr:SEP domain protein [Cordyceps fumosorosea ARSEF 2679]OAA72379.1 SEP domain protein [Cordyceps fumosorosea ARSEF 2679]